MAEQIENNSRLDKEFQNNLNNELALKGYVKFDLSIQSKGENPKVYFKNFQQKFIQKLISYLNIKGHI